jgi:hypothetical protein
MNRNLRNRFKLEFKNQLFIKLLLTAVLIYSTNQTVEGICKGLLARIFNVTTEVETSNLFTNKEGADNASVKQKNHKLTPPALLDVSVSIVSDATNHSICRGTAITFTATPTNGGSTPSYQWKKNGVNAGTGPTVTLNNVLNNDVITVVMTTSLSAATVNNTTATSNAIATTVNSLPSVVSTTPAIIPSCSSTGTATINAVPSNGSVIDWYASTASTTPLLTSSNSYTTPAISASTTYYAVARDTATGCKSNGATAQSMAINWGPNNAYILTTKPVTGSFTIEFWLNTTGLSGAGCASWRCGEGIVSANTTATTNDFGITMFNNYVAFGLGNPDVSIKSTSLINGVGWKHVAATWDSTSGAMRLYIDGILEGSATGGTASRNGQTAMRLGSLLNAPANGAYGFSRGSLDEVRIWRKVKTQADILANMYNNVNGREDGLAQYFNFNQGIFQGNNGGVQTLFDLSSNGYNGTLNAFQGLAGGVQGNYVFGYGLNPAQYPVTVTKSATPSVSSTGNGSLICGGGTTIITATASAGSKIDWYAASTGGTALAAGVGSFTTPTLSATTTYYAEARDTVTDCVSLSRTAVTATVNGAPTAGITNNTGSTELTCTRTAISVTATGGSTYLWSNSLGSAANASITSPGTYTVTVTGANGCTSTASITVTRDVAAPIAGITNNTGSTILNCSTSAISVTATGGSSYLWSNSLGSSANASITSAGTYTATVTSVNGCTATSSITITSDVTTPSVAITNNTSSTILNCTTTAIEVTATGGDSYSWSNNLGISANASIPAAGTYIVTATGANGCTATASITASQNIAAPTSGITNNTNSTLLNCSITSISLTATGGVSYSWSNNLGSSSNVSIIEPGTYTVTVTGANGCTSTASVAITQNTATSTGDTTANACNSFTWYETTYTSSATPTRIYTNANGCDSIVTLQLTINTPPAQPTLACYETATFNTTSCSWDVTGSQPSMPTLACYETATFNTTSCSWDVTGSQPSMPTLACYESTNFNTTSCSWVVTGSQPSMPTLACYETATFNTTSCSWDVTGSQTSMPTLACYETASFNTTSCSWDVTGSQPSIPTLACYETASFNTSTCVWDVTGTQPSIPTLACYESANFNTSTCVWDVTGSQPSMPTLACYETANFNTGTCSWDVTGSQPSMPTLACYESANFNTASCSWVVTGSQPSMPTLTCYETANFNTNTCAWVVTGSQPSMPTLACYETANFNTTSCAWDVTGSQPSQPTLACYESANFNTITCSWDLTGTQPSQPSLACYESANFNTNTCSWDVTGSQPSMPTLACYETASFNTTTCIWDVTGLQPTIPTLACYETASFNTSTCVWDVTGTQPSIPTLECYESANFNTSTCSWDVTESQPIMPTLACYETANFNTTSCSWVVTGSQPAMPTLACYETATFNTTSCSWVIIYNGTNSSTTQTACSGYTWNGSSYTQSGTYTYNYTNASGCASVDTLKLTINTIPAAPVVTNGSRCGTGTVTLTATSATGTVVDWYASSSATTPFLSASNTYTTPSISTTANYFLVARDTVTGCLSAQPSQPVQVNNALYFDGTNDFISVFTNTGIPIGNSNYTIEAWIKPHVFTTSTNTNGIIGWGNWSLPNKVNAFRLDGAGLLNYWNGPDLITLSSGTVSSIFTAQQWRHVACSYDGTTRKLYVDGFVVASDIPTGGNTTPYSSNLKIGTTTNTEYFNGALDEIRVWNLGRTQTQIQANMNSTLTGNESGLVSYYNFDQGVSGANNTGISTLLDLTANKNNGTLNNFSLTGNTSNFVSGPSNVVYSSRTVATATVNSLPASAVAVDGSRFGTGTVSLSATVTTGNTVDWYVAATGGTALSTGSTAFTTPSISSTTIYYAESRNITSGCVSASRTAVTATVNALLVVGVNISSNATNNSICRGKAVTYTANPTNGGNTPTYQWKRNGVNIANGSSIVLNNVLSNDNISVVMTTSLSAASVTSTTATSNTITLTVNNLPSVVSTTPASITSCTASGSTTINAVPSTGSVIDWYASTSSTTPLLTSSNSFTTPNISANTTYYPVARDTVTGCQSNGLTAENMAINMGPNNAYIQTPKTVSGSFTIEFWFKPAGTSSAGCSSWRCGEGLVDASTGDPNDRDFGITIYNSFVAFGMGNGAGNPEVSILSTTNVSTRVWRHIAASWDSTSGAMRLYVNGNLEASATGGTGSRNGQTLMRLGSLLEAPSNGFYGYFSGSLDEVRVWRKVRTQTEIQANYTNNLNGREDGLTQYYNFNQGMANNGYNATQTTLIDITPNGFNGSLNQFMGLNLTGIQGNYWGTFDLGIDPAKYPVVVTKIAVPTVTSSTGSTICGSGTTTLTAAASAGAKIDWYDSASGGSTLATGVGSFTTPTLSATTTYYAESRDTTTGCISVARTAVTATVRVVPTAGITNNTGSTELTCTRTAISVTATGGSTYLWSNSLGTSANASITAAGTYTVTVTASNGCTATSSITVTRDATAPTAVITNNTGTTELTCTTTAISVTATGGTSYLWSNSLGSSANASIIAAGTYTVTVTGANGCTATSSITTTQNNTAPAAGIANNTGATILTCTRTSINVTATGVGSSYSWNNGLGSLASASITSPGTYTVTVTAANACTTTSSITVTQDVTAPASGITNNTGSTELTCTTSSISVTATGGSTYEWSNSLGSSTSASITSPGTYTVTVTGANGCTSTASVSITQNIATSTGDTTAVVCNSFTWNGTTYTSSASPTHIYANANGCDSIVTLHLTINTPPAQPTLACYEIANLNSTTCSWVVTGTQPTMPTLACYETANFNTATCSWDVTGTQPSIPIGLACYETATFNTTNCAWVVTGSQPSMPTLACYESASFNTTTCVWDLTGLQPSMPTLACYETANFNTTNCSWDVTGSQPSLPTLACYQTASFNTTICAWDVTGTQPTMPTLACYKTANFNTTNCNWDVTGSQPLLPTLACYQTASFNTTTCAWDVTGTQPTMPTLACYETANFNTTNCNWDVTGSQPSMPTIACYETASFNTTTCIWDVTGSIPAPTAAITNNTGSTTLNCTTTTINVTATGGTSYSWSNSLGSSANASITAAGTYTVTATAANGCTSTASLTVTQDTAAVPIVIFNNPLTTLLNCNTQSISLNAAPAILENFNSGQWNTSNFILGAPSIGSGSVVNGAYLDPTNSRSPLRTVNQYQPNANNVLTVSATIKFTPRPGNNGFMDDIGFIATRSSGTITSASQEPVGAKIRIHNFSNGYTGFPDGYQGFLSDSIFRNPVQVTMTDNGTSIICRFVNLVTLAEFTHTANTSASSGNYVTFSGGSTVYWDDIQISYGSSNVTYTWANGNGTSLGNSASTSINAPGTYTVTSTAANGCTSSASVAITQNIATSTGDTTVTACNSFTWYGTTYTSSANPTRTFTNANGCDSIVTLHLTINTSPAQPTLACYESATFNITSCSWVVTGTQPALPTLACYETANFNTTSCSWDVTGSQPTQPTLACYETASFNTSTCIWDVTGTHPVQPTLACYESATFNTTSCSWDVTGTQPSAPSGLACYETANFNTTTCSWDVTGSLPDTIVTTIINCGDYTWSTNGQVYTQSGTYISYENCQDYTLNLTVLPTTIYYADTDGDGYGNPSATILACNGAPNGYVAQSGDCNDTSATAYPGSTEICGNGIDDDCDGQIDEGASLVTNPITGNLQICGLYAGATTLTTAPIAGISTYNWTVPSDITITSGQGTNTITVYWDYIYLLSGGIIGEVTVTAMGTTTGCGTLVPAKLPVDLQYTAPVTPPSISGPNAICPNESGVYSIALVKRATSYEWSVPTGATINSGNGSNIINVSYGNGFNGGLITVGAKNVCGLSTPLRTRNIRLNVLPAPSAITGPVNGLCSASNSNYLVTSVVGATGYTWTVPANSTINGGSNNNNISVNYNASFTTGNISVAAINNCGIGATRNLAVKAAPTRPGTITGPTSSCAGSNQTYSIATVQGASNYTWTVPGGAVINSGQGSKVININHATVASPNGIITVKSSNDCGTSALKVLSVVTSACPRLGDASIQLQVYPNPANEYINVSFIVDETQQVKISLRDAAGRVVYNEATDAVAGFNNLQIDLSNLSKGVYFVQLQTASSSENTRLILK